MDEKKLEQLSDDLVKTADSNPAKDDIILEQQEAIKLLQQELAEVKAELEKLRAEKAFLPSQNQANNTKNTSLRHPIKIRPVSKELPGQAGPPVIKAGMGQSASLPNKIPPVLYSQLRKKNKEQRAAVNNNVSVRKIKNEEVLKRSVLKHILQNKKR
ncbi:hypothetical protein [Halobacillus massiliensis]|uniref:hypothetical protein n=1 Tax=Halobacillus massiliensis TaxID=1926286 RepID=UPI0009E4ECEA|nr:hypothetical protein [Halobacillus massiliensis]